MVIKDYFKNARPWRAEEDAVCDPDATVHLRKLLYHVLFYAVCNRLYGYKSRLGDELLELIQWTHKTDIESVARLMHNKSDAGELLVAYYLIRGLATRNIMYMREALGIAREHRNRHAEEYTLELISLYETMPEKNSKRKEDK